uniref:Uncharacterized protein n=1 Tax=Molossus molossus TaxID=27622 RepID=A0A7J8HIU9_MOLMO|nr:hypothetical protein HJG59_010978 [Molossus molossus]
MRCRLPLLFRCLTLQVVHGHLRKDLAMPRTLAVPTAVSAAWSLTEAESGGLSFHVDSIARPLLPRSVREPDDIPEQAGTEPSHFTEGTRPRAENDFLLLLLLLLLVLFFVNPLLRFFIVFRVEGREGGEGKRVGERQKGRETLM